MAAAACYDIISNKLPWRIFVFMTQKRMLPHWPDLHVRAFFTTMILAFYYYLEQRSARILEFFWYPLQYLE